MANWASPSERFVEIPGVVEIRWVSDDPDYYTKPIDLFDQQMSEEGLPDWYGKKDKSTTEQAYFTCNVCECDLKSVVTLRAHCKGTQHIRKSLQKKKEYRDAQKLTMKHEVKSEEEYKTLEECLENITSEPVVGLENITEYRSPNHTTPYYHCDLEGCHDDQGRCDQIFKHMMSNRHKQSWLEAKTGIAPRHTTEITQKIAEYTKDYKRDYRVMKLVEDDEKWRLCKKSKIRSPRSRRISGSSHYHRDYHRVKEESSSSGYGRSRDRHSQHDDRWSSGVDYDRRKSERRPEEREWKRSGEEEEERLHEYVEDGERNRNSRDRERRSDRADRYVRESFKREEPVRSRSRERRDKEARERETREIEQRDREMQIRDTRRNEATPVQEESRTNPEPDSGLEEVLRLNKKVADTVKKRLNRYYAPLEDTEPENAKIASEHDYTKLAKKFSHDLREQIKDTYFQFNRCLLGIKLTEDNKALINTVIDMHFDPLPVVGYH